MLYEVTKKEEALDLLDQVTDWAIGQDYMDYIGEIEKDCGMTLDEAFKILRQDDKGYENDYN